MARADREQQMITVAEQVFAERGYHAASMDEIAQQVGVSKPMLYEYFGSKEGLLRACILRARTELREVTQRAVAEAPTLRDLLWQGVAAFFRFADTHARAWRVLRQETALAGTSGAEEIETFRSQQNAFTAGLLATYLPAAAEWEVVAYAELLGGACERLAIWREGRPEVTPEQATDMLMDVVWTGLEGLLERQTPVPAQVSDSFKTREAGASTVSG